MSDLQLTHWELEAWKHSVFEKGEAPEDAILWKDVDMAVKAVNMEAREVTIAYSTESVDRDGDIIRQRGIDLKAFRKNPVVLFAHGGSRFGGSPEGQLPIARAMKLFRSEDNLKSLAVDRFTEPDLNPLGDTVFRMLTNKPAFLNAASIGFRPVKVERREEDDSDGSLFWAPTDFIKTEKLEHSIVPVPANPEALQGAKSVGIDLAPIKSWAEGVLDMAARMSDGLSREHLEKCYRIASANTKVFTVPDVDTEPAVIVGNDEKDVEVDKGSVPRDVSRQTADEGTAWSRPRLNDFPGEGAFEDRSAAERRKIAGHFAWAEAMPPTTFGQLKLPHHRASDGYVVFRGVVAAMAALLGARGGVNIPSGDRKSVHTHLASHYKQFDREPPEFRDYEADELEEVLAKMIDDAISVEGKEAEGTKPEDTKEETTTEDTGTKEPEPETTEPEKEPEEPTEKEPDQEPEPPKETEPEETKTDEGDGETAFEFPSIKDEDEAAKDHLEDQIAELRAGMRSITAALKQLVGAIKVTGTPEEKTSEPEPETKEEGDEVVLLLADDEPETKEEPPSGKVGRFIAEETAKAVTGALRKHTGRLPN